MKLYPLCKIVCFILINQFNVQIIYRFLNVYVLQFIRVLNNQLRIALEF